VPEFISFDGSNDSKHIDRTCADRAPQQQARLISLQFILTVG